MVITSAINIDMQYKYVNTYVDAVQYDVNSRNVEITLLKAGNRADIPTGSTFEVKFKRPDGSSGSYSELSNGQAAVTRKETNVIVVWLSEFILSEAGATVVSVCVKDGETEVNTFSFIVNVQESPNIGTGLARMYPNTYDATATPSDIANGKTAYVKGEKILGTSSQVGGGNDGFSPIATVTQTNEGAVISITDKTGTTTATVTNGADGITPSIGSNGNWFLGEEDTGNPSRGEKGARGLPGNPGTSVRHTWDGSVLTITSGVPGPVELQSSSADLKGPKGDSVGIKSIRESTESGGSSRITFTDGHMLAVKNGVDGQPGANGITPHIGSNGNWFLGEEDTGNPSRGERGNRGNPGTSASHTWDGSVLTITSASGISSADLKGPKGDSVGIKSITENAESGGASRIMFTDGKMLAIRNGIDGRDPVRGVDYWTAEDIAAIDADIATELAKRGQLKPEFANSIEECTDTTKLYVLPDGMIYAYMKYESASAGGQPLFTNRANPASSDWQADKRFSSSSGSISDCVGAVVSNTIAAKKGDIIRVKGLQNGSGETLAAYVSIMGYSDAAGETKVFGSPVTLDKTKSQHANGVKDIVTLEDGAIVYKAFNVIGSSGGTVGLSNSNTVVGIRASGVPVTTVDDIIVTVNEEIKYSEASTETGYKWQSTGHAFVPADYEDRIIAVEQTAVQHTTKIAAIEKAVKNGSADKTEAEALERIKVWDKPVYDSAPVTLLGDDRTKPALTSEDMTVAAIHAKYRALMAAHPRYIKETYLGPCTSSDTFPAVDMLRFDFCEPDGLTEPTFGPEETHETKPKIIFISGIHKEWAGVYGLYYALEEITTNPAFYDIRRNTHIIVVPCSNPFGLSTPTAIEGWQMSHVNANGIAPHNNFGVNHRSLGSVGEYNYGGTTPYSELETQYIDAVMAENSDAIAFVTCHNNNYSTYYGSHVIWASSATYHMCNLTFRLVDKMTTAWLDKYGQTLKDAIDEYKFNMDADDYRLGRATMSTSRGTEQQNATKYGILATNLEIPDRMRVFSGETRFTSETMSRGAEVYANFIRIILAAYDANDRKVYAPNLPWSE